jgi:hypothetical protein
MNIDMQLLRQQLELVDIISDSLKEEEQTMMDGVGDLLDKILHGDAVLYQKELHGNTE